MMFVGIFFSCAIWNADKPRAFYFFHLVFAVDSFQEIISHTQKEKPPNIPVIDFV